MPDWFPSHLSAWKVLAVALVVGGVFVAMHGVGHRWDTGVCNLCRLMAA